MKKEKNCFAALMFDYAPEPTVPKSEKFQKLKHILPQGFHIKDCLPVVANKLRNTSLLPLLKTNLTW